MKKIFSFVLIFLCILPMFSETENLIFKLTDNTLEVFSFDKDSKSITFFGSDNSKNRNQPLKEFIDIEGFSKFEQLEDMGFYWPKYRGDWNFLKDAKKLKSLGLITVNAKSMDVLSDLENIEVLELDYFIDEINLNNFLQKDIDFSKLKKLKKKIFNLRVKTKSGFYYPGRIPRFVNVQNSPEIYLGNNGIKDLQDSEINMLKQYSIVHLGENPISKDIEKYKKDINIK